MVIGQLADIVRQSGYDRMVVHDVDPDGAQNIGDYLSVYRVGEAWSRWCFARHGSLLIAWCALTGADMGSYTCLPDALKAVIPALVLPRAEPDQSPSKVTKLTAHVRRPTPRFGSAA